MPKVRGLIYSPKVSLMTMMKGFLSVVFGFAVLGRSSSVEEDEVDALERLEHLQSEAKSDKIQGLPDDLKSKMKPMKFTPPQLSDEEERSQHMPDYLACDACQAVTIQLEKGLSYAHRHVSMKKDIKQWDVIETIENICDYKTFE